MRRSNHEGASRLGHLAPRSRRAREPRAGTRRFPPSPWARGRGGDNRRRRAGSAGVHGPLGLSPAPGWRPAYPEGPTLAFAGRLGVQKSLDVALAALAALPEVTLAIAGDGPERERLERRARGRGPGGRAPFPGGVS